MMGNPKTPIIITPTTLHLAMVAGIHRNTHHITQHITRSPTTLITSLLTHSLTSSHITQPSCSPNHPATPWHLE